MNRLERDNKVPLEFEGWEIGFVSTHIPGKERWTELRVWAVEADQTDTMWVLETVGRSVVPGEVDRRDAHPCRTVAELVARLSNDGSLTAPGRAVLQMAQREDDELSYSLAESANKDEVERL